MRRIVGRLLGRCRLDWLSVYHLSMVRLRWEEGAQAEKLRDVEARGKHTLPTSIRLPINIIPIRTIKQISIMRRDDRFHAVGGDFADGCVEES